MANPPNDAFPQQVAQGSVDSGVRLAKDARQLRRVDKRRPAEGVEQLSFGDCHASSVTIECLGGQPSCGTSLECNDDVEA